ncbi:hypothetical protein M405DRAFT_805117 [Rhizopogon salebrosus TDB-379]|nr:hypothetical protein M405DRAFT_805117 [Rhizopogon salebrosus TDB-379]
MMCAPSVFTTLTQHQCTLTRLATCLLLSCTIFIFPHTLLECHALRHSTVAV